MGIINLMYSYGYKVFDRPYELNIVAQRTKNRVANKFDDYLYAFYKDNKGVWIYHTWIITTDPGTKSLKFPVNSKGTAILCPGQYIDTYQIGLHRGEYEALVQAKPVRVFRDNNLNNILDLAKGTMKEGFFGINIHKAGLDSNTVENWSAGCAVFKRAKDFNEFMLLCKKHRKLYGNSFTVSLIQE